MSSLKSRRNKSKKRKNSSSSTKKRSFSKKIKRKNLKKKRSFSSSNSNKKKNSKKKKINIVKPSVKRNISSSSITSHTSIVDVNKSFDEFIKKKLENLKNTSL
jgi:hypothetical protein